MTSSVFPKDERGFPVMLADVPGSGVVKQSNAASGNKNHDTRSGKFGSTGPAPKGTKPSDNPANIATDPAELQRMLSAVRDAARQFDTLNQGDIREFLKGRAKDPSVVDADKFLQMVKIQRVQDLADILDQQFRTKGEDAPGRRRVKITAPRGYVVKAFKELTDADVKLLVDNLVSRGHEQEEVETFFKSKGFDTVQFTETYETEEARRTEIILESNNQVTDAMSKFAESIKIEAPTPKPKRIKKTIERDDRGLITGVIEEEIADV